MPPPKGSFNPIKGPGDYSTTSTVHNDTYEAINPLKADLTEKTVYINGASRGPGRSMALSFAKAGASQIAISARSNLEKVARELKEAAKEAGRPEPEVLSLQMDVASPESVSKGISKIGTTFAKLDIVINNAAIMGQMKTVLDSDIDVWWETSRSAPYKPQESEANCGQ